MKQRAEKKTKEKLNTKRKLNKFFWSRFFDSHRIDLEVYSKKKSVCGLCTNFTYSVCVLPQAVQF